MSEWIRVPLIVVALATVAYVVKGKDLGFSFVFALLSAAAVVGVGFIVGLVLDRHKEE
ncbi:MAG: hypothetical protein M3179_02850 [Actinomycetota bacterium]|nr:hypothetical protein [Actinomycetota bacterium]